MSKNKKNRKNVEVVANNETKENTVEETKVEETKVEEQAPAVEEPKAEEPKAEKKAKKAKAEKKAPKLTKKAVCVELVSQEGGATIEEMAQAVKDRGLGDDMRVNKTTCGLWMSKIGFDVTHDKKTGKYAKVVKEVKAEAVA